MLYIHQFPDWTHFRLDYRRVLDELGKTRFMEGQLVRTLQLSGLTPMEKEIMERDLVASHAIDGIELSPKEVREELENRIGGSPLLHYIDAVENANRPLTEERLFRWHSALTGENTYGYRNNESNLKTAIALAPCEYQGPEPERLKAEMRNFLAWFESPNMDGVVKAAIAQFWFLCLRPFKNGNGRIARAITLMQLARAEDSAHFQYAIIAQFQRNCDDYFRILNKTQRGNGDLTEWVLWFLAQMQEAIRETERKIAPLMEGIAFRVRHGDTPISEREQVLLTAVFQGKIPRDFTAKEAASLYGVSHDTALREIQGLMDKGILKASEKRGRSQRYSIADTL